MIPLSIQIRLILFSFFFGIFFFLSYQLVQKGIYCQNLFLRIINTFLFIFLLTIVYFIGIEKISDGILHLYSLGLIVLGFVIGDMIARTLKK